MACYLEPSGRVINAETGEFIQRWTTPSGQTMGYHPAIDSHESFGEGKWALRTEALAWSAGAELIVRHRTRDGRTDASQRSEANTSVWFTNYTMGRQGVDDITFLKYLRPHQKYRSEQGSDRDYIILGTASGHLQLVSTPRPEDPKRAPRSCSFRCERRFVTNNRQIMSGDISPSDSPLIATTLGNDTVAMYSAQPSQEESPIQPLSVSKVLRPSGETRVWSSRFLSMDTVAVGLGPSQTPIKVYDISPTGMSQNPIWTFRLRDSVWMPYDRAGTRGGYAPKSIAVYPIVPLPSTSVGGSDSGKVFLSGGYDGIIRLHDMRSPLPSERHYCDPTDNASLYCLQTIARERLVAGTSRHNLLKFFDLRVSGGRMYHYADTRPESKVPALEEGTNFNPRNRYDWNLYIRPYKAHTHPRSHHPSESAIYNLSSPSPTSSSLYIGLENTVVQCDFVSMLDQHPDPITCPKQVFTRQKGERSGKGKREELDVKGTWSSYGKVLQLSMYEQNETEIRLKVQRGIGRYGAAPRMNGLDERWIDVQDLDAQQNHGPGGHGRRGHFWRRG
jgi:WD40 repeat protein